mmetsp:Transcript_1800/g.5915  ORF Transcript_1800/g.5915 Transcript_1800/m.5915 type:complete len:276 (-) Transcript_1800:123-950(-)
MIKASLCRHSRRPSHREHLIQGGKRVLRRRPCVCDRHLFRNVVAKALVHEAILLGTKQEARKPFSIRDLRHGPHESAAVPFALMLRVHRHDVHVPVLIERVALVKVVRKRDHVVLAPNGWPDGTLPQRWVRQRAGDGCKARPQYPHHRRGVFEVGHEAHAVASHLPRDDDGLKLALVALDAEHEFTARRGRALLRAVPETEGGRSFRAEAHDVRGTEEANKLSSARVRPVGKPGAERPVNTPFWVGSRRPGERAAGERGGLCSVLRAEDGDALFL